MIRRGLIIPLLLPLFILPLARAEDQDLQQKIEAVRTQIEQEEAVRDKLRDDLENMDVKVDNLKKQLKELEEKITKNKK